MDARQIRFGILSLGMISAIVAVTPTGAQAQSTMAARDTEVSVTVTAADRYRSRAEELYAKPQSQWDRVVELHLAAARASSMDDVGRVQDLWMAGVVSASLGRVQEAHDYLKQSGEAALEFGDLFRAGEAFLLAAVAAAQMGNNNEARHLLDHAELVTHSELLSPDECDCLKSRVAAYKVAIR